MTWPRCPYCGGPRTASAQTCPGHVDLVVLDPHYTVKAKTS